MFAKKRSNPGLTFVAQGTKLSGECHFAGEALIGGEVNGKISSAGKITIEVDGYIDGELSCSELKVAGNFKGKLKCDKLNITSTGTVEGEVACESMEIFEGGQFIGMRVREEIALLNTFEQKMDDDIEGELQSN
ncbi:polymer-forming cytoskeletal protein [Shewanella sp. D64]|uniref:bactofilin family protein n=1 Tax=unclassified Shewanella TaxID=196818 RepID=UPI0022BA1F36|nr:MULTISPECIES: polymer-forming cytoskeletal protein [unclassified Shewanella]MEC4727777.1 polymer-forming cytoskeletal protein [Shewanella sp. D64]MEC4737540.1 polymer-forming cytoskeletal protein [Shewanella sp. E94]WBJ97349.1 polymer-forming cytoskeletal protein [Shewanella sp. MTB7]